MTDEVMFSKDRATNNWQVIHSIFREICKLKPSTTETNQYNQSYHVPSAFTNLWIFKVFLLSQHLHLQEQRGPQQTG